jgi:hypothetical protein
MQYRTLTNKGRPFVALIRKIFFVLFFTAIVGCVKVSATCKVGKIEENNLHNSLEECRDNPTINITKDF